MAALLSDPEEVLADVDSVMADSVSEAPPIEPQAQEEEHSAYDTDSEEAAVIEPERDADIESEPVAESLQQDVVSEDVREPSQLRRLSMGLIRLTLSTLILTSTFRMNLKPNANSCYRTLLGG